MQSLKELREKIQTLENERSRLLIEVESLRKAVESRAEALEGEVIHLREESKNLHDLLNG